MPLNFRVRITFYYGSKYWLKIYGGLTMNNLIKVTDNYSISEEKYRKMINIVKQYFDEIGDLGFSIGINEGITINDLPNNEALQAITLIFMNSFTEGAIESINQDKHMSEDEIATMRSQTSQVLTKMIFNHV